MLGRIDRRDFPLCVILLQVVQELYNNEEITLNVTVSYFPYFKLCVATSQFTRFGIVSYASLSLLQLLNLSLLFRTLKRKGRLKSQRLAHCVLTTHYVLYL
jgi:hypothetical protein